MSCFFFSLLFENICICPEHFSMCPKNKVITHNTLNICWKFSNDVIILPSIQFNLYLVSSDFPQNILDFFDSVF